MATESSSIDDLLSSVVNNTPAPQYIEPEIETPEVETLKIEGGDYDEPERIVAQEVEPEAQAESEPTAEDADEYGNKPEPDNEIIRERLSRQARKHEAEMATLRAQLSAKQAQEVQEAAQGFEYNPNAQGDWQHQLASFVKQTVNNMTSEREQLAHQQREVQAQIEFESKFRDDLQRFPDFEQAITGVGAEISDPMVHATRSMKSPAAFLYAAAKRAPAELQRIAKIQDPYAQIAAMGALEVTLRQTKAATKAPKPIGRAADDGSIPYKAEKKETIEDLIAASEARIRAKRSALRR